VTTLLFGVRNVTAQQTSVVKAQRFEVVDVNGVRLATLGRNDDVGGRPELNLYSSRPKFRTEVSQFGLNVFDDDGVNRVGVGILPDYDSKRNVMSLIPELILKDTKGKTIYTAR
jgi:hypothetical protein